MTAVVLDGLGVVFRTARQVAELLRPFARERGCALPESRMRALYREASLGRLTSAGLWATLGVPGDPAALDAALVAGDGLAPGAGGLLRLLAGRGVATACLTNDVAEWSRLRRRAHGLEALVPHWTVSGEAGARKPDPAIFEQFLASTGLRAGRCLFVDDRQENLDAARRLGFATLFFRGPGTFQEIAALTGSP